MALTLRVSPTLCSLCSYRKSIDYVRQLSSSVATYNNIKSGVPKSTPDRSRALTYEEAMKPHTIGVKKTWNSWNSTGLYGELKHTGEISVQDILIRKFINGTWHRLFVSEIIIKRRANLIIIAGIVRQAVSPHKMYFLKGYSEELLGFLLKQPVRMEIQTVESIRDVTFRYK